MLRYSHKINTSPAERGAYSAEPKAGENN